MIAAYDAPFPNPESKAGARAFPALIPTEPDAPGAAEGRRVADALREDDRPTLVLWADSDIALPLSVGEQVSARLNYPAPRVIENASHFLHEDAGEEIGAIIAEWLGRYLGVEWSFDPRIRVKLHRGAPDRPSRTSLEWPVSNWTRCGGPSSSSQVTVPGQ